MVQERVAGRIKKFGLRLGLGSGQFGEASTNGPELVDLQAQGEELLPPVELWVGTHPSMLRATRVLVRSLISVRNPARRYRVHLMSSLKGISRSGWRTGWEGYAAEIARFAGKGSRALYLDATFLFERDPGPVFDESQGGIVNLISKPVSGIAPVPAPYPWAILRGSVVQGGEGRAARKWREIEVQADKEGFKLFTRQRPTQEFGVLIDQYRQMHEENYFPGVRLKHHVEGVRELVMASGTKTILDYGAGKAEGYERIAGEPEQSPWRGLSSWSGVRVRCFDPGVPAFDSLPEERFDGVISTDVVEHLAPFDVPWVLGEMFDRASCFVFVIASCMPAIKTLPDGRNAHTTIEPPAWWRDQMHTAAFGRRGIDWRIGCDRRTLLGKRTETYGPPPESKEAEAIPGYRAATRMREP